MIVGDDIEAQLAALRTVPEAAAVEAVSEFCHAYNCDRRFLHALVS